MYFSSSLKPFLFVFSFFVFPLFSSAQDSLRTLRRPGNFVILPATAYTPETGFTVGAIADYFFDLGHGDEATRMSKISLVGVYTTKRQLFTSMSWKLFTPQERFIIDGELKFSNFTDRHYGTGNEIGEKIYTLDQEKDQLDSLNFLPYKYTFYFANLAVNMRLKKRWYFGLQMEYESALDFEPLGDSTIYESAEIIPSESIGRRAGLGWKLSYDSRKNINNPLSGTFVQLDNWYFRKGFGGDQNYQLWSLDARHYFHTYKNQTLALRLLLQHGSGEVPYRGLYKVGGKSFIRGVFEGSYRDRQLLGFQTEYRLPLWGNLDAAFWKFWHRLGVVFFCSGATVATEFEDLDLGALRMVAGGGIRVLFSKKQRVNLRIDYGVALNKTTSLAQRQTGLYFFLSEAF